MDKWPYFLSRYEVQVCGCWLWLGSKNTLGYGKVYDGHGIVYAHRAAYEATNGPIPDGLVIDHLCRTPQCINPEHLEAVTQQENSRRGHSKNAAKTHCPRGHAYEGENLMFTSRGSRMCRACVTVRATEWKRKKRREAGIPEMPQKAHPRRKHPVAPITEGWRPTPKG